MTWNRTAVALSLLLCTAAYAQDRFDAASVKPSQETTRANVVEIAPGGERLTARNVPLKLLIMTAYDVNVRHVSGGPDWVTSRYYDVDAAAQNSGGRERIQRMLQSLLADRFNLKVHRETRELPVYVLAAEKYQSHLRENKSGGEPHIRRGKDGQIVFENVPIFQLTSFLSLRLERDVLDRTGLAGNYDFELSWIPDVPRRGDGAGDSVAVADPAGPSIFTALREQLGLTLTAAKGPSEILVIDHADQPSAN